MRCGGLHGRLTHIIYRERRIFRNRKSKPRWIWWSAAKIASDWERHRWRNEEKRSKQIRETNISNMDDLSKENIKGVVLALLSSLFIGASFIIKKKGLRRAAAASGVRAGEFLLTYVFLKNEKILLFYSGFFVFFSIGFVSFDSWFAGVGGHSYLLEPLWWLGMITSKWLIFKLLLLLFFFTSMLKNILFCFCFFVIFFWVGIA